MKLGRAALLISFAIGALVLTGCFPLADPGLMFIPHRPVRSIKVTPGREGYLVTGPLYYFTESVAGLQRPYKYSDIHTRFIIFTGCFPTDDHSCVLIQVTGNPSDEEFWQFEARVIVRDSYGIPHGRSPTDYFIVGSERQCEEVRALVSAKGTPTELCHGPHYFNRVESQ